VETVTPIRTALPNFGVIDSVAPVSVKSVPGVRLKIPATLLLNVVSLSKTGGDPLCCVHPCRGPGTALAYQPA